STLGMPVPAADYLRRSFRLDIPDEFWPRFRLVEADAFVRSFASDRAHMRTPGGRWKKAPPPWPPILPEGVPPNLRSFVDMSEPFLGERLDLRGLQAKIADA